VVEIGERDRRGLREKCEVQATEIKLMTKKSGKRRGKENKEKKRMKLDE
jgi:hypothetical protein